MKMLFAICVFLSFAGGVYMQTAGMACNDTSCDIGLICQESMCRSKIDGACVASSTEQCVITAAPCGAGPNCTCPTGATAEVSKEACKCNVSGKVISMDKTKCVAKIDETCSKPEDCIANSNCNATKCACMADYIVNANKDQCLMKVMGKCSKDKDCLVDGMCDSGSCMCKANFTATSNHMKCKMSTGQKCGDIAECGENAECNNTICTCTTNYYSQPDQRCGMKVMANCTKDTDCVPNAKCENTKCACMPNYTIVDEKFCNSGASGASAVVASLVLLLAALVTAH